MENWFSPRNILSDHLPYTWLPPMGGLRVIQGMLLIAACSLLRLCLSISDFHPDTWNPAWSVSTILTGLLSFMLEDTPTMGSIATSTYEKHIMARDSAEFNLKDEIFVDLFPDVVRVSNLRVSLSSSSVFLSGCLFLPEWVLAYDWKLRSLRTVALWDPDIVTDELVKICYCLQSSCDISFQWVRRCSGLFPILLWLWIRVIGIHFVVNFSESRGEHR